MSAIGFSRWGLWEHGGLTGDVRNGYTRFDEPPPLAGVPIPEHLLSWSWRSGRQPYLAINWQGIEWDDIADRVKMVEAWAKGAGWTPLRYKTMVKECELSPEEIAMTIEQRIAVGRNPVQTVRILALLLHEEPIPCTGHPWCRCCNGSVYRNTFYAQRQKSAT